MFAEAVQQRPGDSPIRRAVQGCVGLEVNPVRIGRCNFHGTHGPNSRNTFRDGVPRQSAIHRLEEVPRFDARHADVRVDCALVKAIHVALPGHRKSAFAGLVVGVDGANGLPNRFGVQLGLGRLLRPLFLRPDVCRLNLAFCIHKVLDVHQPMLEVALVDGLLVIAVPQKRFSGLNDPEEISVPGVHAQGPSRRRFLLCGDTFEEALLCHLRHNAQPIDWVQLGLRRKDVQAQNQGCKCA